jgi:hypothetical protein
MKVQIVTNQEDAIQGYINYNIRDIGVMSSSLANNECEQILALNTLSLFSEEEVANFLGVLISKLRINGELIVSGIDQTLFCKSVLNESLDQTSANRVIAQSKSMLKMDSVKNFLTSGGLKLEQYRFNGINYEIRAKRSN